MEYEIRKNNSSKIIKYLTKIMEDYVINNSHIATSVSKKKKIFLKILQGRDILIPKFNRFRKT